MTPVRIALTGKFRSGKDTVADLLREHSYFKTYAFADGITEIIVKYFAEDLRTGKPRQHYQVIGQSLRQLDENVWVKELHRKRQLYGIGNAPELITDVRQPNEVLYCKSHGFKVIKVTADDTVRQQRAFHAGDVWDASAMLHETEVAVDSIAPDYIIDNSGTIDDLVVQVAKIYEQILQEV